MKTKEKKLLSTLLHIAAEEFSNHGCNDVDSAFYNDWTEEELKEFNHKLNVFNGVDDIEDEQYTSDSYNTDWFVMHYFANFISNNP